MGAVGPYRDCGSDRCQRRSVLLAIQYRHTQIEGRAGSTHGGEDHLSARQQQLEEAQSALRTGQSQLADARSALEGSENNLRQQQSAATELQRSLEAKQAELKHQHANLLGELASAQLGQGNFDAALRLGGERLRGRPGLPSNSFSASSSMASLAAGVTQARWWLGFATGQKALLSAAFSPDGSRIVTASYDKTARVWDAATGKEIVVLRGHDGPVNSAAFSPDGKRIVTASDDKTARVWDAATGKKIVVLRGHDGAVFSAAFSPDGSRIVTASRDQTARVWDAATGKQIVVLKGHDGTCEVRRVQPRRVAHRHGVSGQDRPRLGRRDRQGRSPSSEAMTTRCVRRVQPRRVAHRHGSGDKTARVWDAATGKEIAVLSGHDGTVDSAAFSPDGSRIVTASEDKTARIWDAATGKEIARPQRPRGRCELRRVQPRRVAHRHGLCGQDRAHLGRRDRQGNRRPQRP